MTGTTARWIHTKIVRFGSSLLVLAALGWFLTGHAAQPTPEGLPTDWSHRHLIFSQPATPEQALRLAKDPRYWQQWYRQNVARALMPASDERAGIDLGHSPGEGGRAHGDWSESLGSGATVGAGNFPAKYSFQITTASCANDYVVFATGLSGASNQASIVAFNNLYSGCTGPVPQVYWAYNTNAGVIMTSPVISGDGTQIAFAQTTTGSSGQGSLVLLKFAPSTTESVSSPATLSPVANNAYRNCTAPCMAEIPLVDGSGTQIDDRTSSAFPDYTHDVLWVGGAVGWLHKISGVFRGAPAEVTSGGFPVQVNPSNPTALSGPVYDYTSTNVFVGDYGGFLYLVNSSTGAVTASNQLDFGTGIVASPIIDVTSETIYVFASSDGTTACPGTLPCSAVYQLSATGGVTTSTESVVGGSSLTPTPLYDGMFDSTYLASANATGNLYVCGNTGGTPTLYQIPISAGTMQPVVTGPTVSSSATAACSPVTDVANPNATNGPTEWFYSSTTAGGLGNNCTAGCLTSFKNQQWQPLTVYVRGQQVLDTNFDIQTARSATGTSGTTAPAWNTTLGGTTDDSNVRWINQGPQTASHAAWQALTLYAQNQIIIDSNGNIEFCTTAFGGLSGAVAPTWATAPNATTTDALITWRNVGAAATASFASAGGSSGIIIDNVVGSGTLAGGSQVYFTTQSNQTCATSGGSGGCAVQASQSALQ
jgi:hypothetical protein